MNNDVAKSEQIFTLYNTAESLWSENDNTGLPSNVTWNAVFFDNFLENATCAFCQAILHSCNLFAEYLYVYVYHA